jgi:hypothetical protein
MAHAIGRNHIHKRVIHIEKFLKKRSVVINNINNQLKIERDLAFTLGSISNLEKALELCLKSTPKNPKRPIAYF